MQYKIARLVIVLQSIIAGRRRLADGMMFLVASNLQHVEADMTNSHRLINTKLNDWNVVVRTC